MGEKALDKFLRNGFFDSKICMEYNENYFQKPEKLHFTLLMLKLHTKGKINRVKRIMAEIGEELTKKMTQFQVQLRGLYYMNDEPERVNVLFTEDKRPEIREKLNEIAAAIFEPLVEGGIVSRQYLHQQRLLAADGTVDVNIHATIMNTKFHIQALERQAEKEGTFYKSDGEDKTINAVRLLKTFEDYHFGTFTLSRVDFSDLMDTNATTGYYECLARINIPPP